VVATSLVFAITLLLSGFGESFSVEAHRFVDDIGVDGYVVRTETKGPFMSPRPFSVDAIKPIAETAGITSAAPLVAMVQPDMYLLGFAFFPPETAHALEPQPGTATVDARLNIKEGETIRVGAKELPVGRVTHGNTVLGGQAIVILHPRDAYDALFGGNAFVTSVAVNGRPTAALPEGFTYVSKSAAVRDMLRPLHVVVRTIRILSVLLWIVAAAIVGSVIYVSTLERVRDFAVFKATGASTGDLLAALVVQAVLLSLLASLVAIGLTYLIAPTFPANVSFPARLLALLPAVAIPIGLIASAAGLRRAMKVDPALAFGGAG
jgi:putative ABC transport system permease protein